MFHLSVGGLCSYACTLESFAVKMFHLTSATCQYAPSFDRGTLQLHVYNSLLFIQDLNGYSMSFIEICNLRDVNIL